MPEDVTMESVVDLIIKEKRKQEHIIDISNTSYRILQNASVSDVKKSIEDNSVILFVVSSKKDIEFNENDYRYARRI